MVVSERTAAVCDGVKKNCWWCQRELSQCVVVLERTAAVFGSVTENICSVWWCQRELLQCLVVSRRTSAACGGVRVNCCSVWWCQSELLQTAAVVCAVAHYSHTMDEGCLEPCWGQEPKHSKSCLNLGLPSQQA